jgi:NAD(P)-dependent dehydrogenase (short-subunit alcohol dehydrogenase family)
MKPRPKPKIVNVVSAVDTLETEKDITFGLVNQALVGMTGALANTLPEKFRINAVAISEREKARSHFEKFDKPDAELFRVKKGIDPDDVARTILYLLSSEAIGLNGQIIKVG